MIKKFTSFILVGALTFTFLAGLVSAESSNIENSPTQDEILLDFEGHGSFKESTERNIGISSNTMYKAKKKDGHSFLYEIVDSPEEQPFSLLMQTNPDTFLAVAEKEVTTKNVQSVLEDNRISDEVKTDLKKLMKEIEDRNLEDTTVTIYSPELIPGSVSINGFEHQYDSYYTGYKGYSYKDTWMYYANYISDPGVRELGGTAGQALYKKAYKHLIRQGIGDLVNLLPLGWVANSLYDIFGADATVGGDSNDKAVVTYVEGKYRRYTSISWLGDWRQKAIMDYINYQTVNIQKMVGRNITNKQQSVQYVPSKSWDIQDQRAYEMKDSTTFWDERIYNYYFFDIQFAAPW
ncbi:hypothetical protein [Paenibacillus sp. EZ-K15]|uniref:hypothetical protein n=1 Tax=Paenibacillus sp. EZ-K15 TaxID=2044275 RepID=UPI000BF7D1C7|nr:hypothetical protein [Paenibacillus sp. EZ-K15]